jgi:hypothetical protein
MLLEVDKEIDAWYNKWRDHIHQGMLALEGVNFPGLILFSSQTGEERSLITLAATRDFAF